MIPILDLGFAQIPTYFFVISASISFLLFFLSARVDKFHFDRKITFNIAIILMISGFIGGRLMHVVFEELDYYTNDPKQVFFFWNGGFVYFGGLILSSICVSLYCKFKKMSFLMWGDFFAPLLSLSHAFGRIGCVLSGCCFGAYCQLPWALDGRHPTAAYLVFGELIIFAIIMYLEKLELAKKGVKHHGTLFFKWIFLSSLLRYCVEFYRDDFRGRFFHLPVLGTLSVSQLICLGLMFVSLGFFLSQYLKKKKAKN